MEREYGYWMFYLMMLCWCLPAENKVTRGRLVESEKMKPAR